MAVIRPPAGFERQPLDIETVPSGCRFGRIYASAFPDPLGFGKTASRFSDPRRRDATKHFGVLYLGETLKVCFLEAVLRDRRDGLIGDLPIEEKEIYARRYAEIETIAELSLVDLRDDHAIRMGVPTDVAKSSRQPCVLLGACVPRTSVASRGIIYPSRLNGHTNIDVFWRAISKLAPARVLPLIGAPVFARAIEDLRVSLVDGPR
ncbi:RES domain-containing protein [Rhizobium leguminosarum]|uniref:RES domain-containing protein n=1 Tax=Rhizobium leguminosarum TaxID=384 RepID=UPI0013BA947B|nr:RES domain-containing protein [Rhizobium leguminosarum]NEI59430.1 RES domain-containing protein [Rhizobium leguminosarum]NEI88270.1 RES domain-containing protein [Rhizobium leguminosarum]